jgi:hypothetical protein
MNDPEGRLSRGEAVMIFFRLTSVTARLEELAEVFGDCSYLRTTCRIAVIARSEEQ